MVDFSIIFHTSNYARYSAWKNPFLFQFEGKMPFPTVNSGFIFLSVSFHVLFTFYGRSFKRLKKRSKTLKTP